jgi:hypothetical protein
MPSCKGEHRSKPRTVTLIEAGFECLPEAQAFDCLRDITAP